MQQALFKKAEVPRFLIFVCLKWPLSVRYLLPHFMPIDELVKNRNQLFTFSDLF